MLSAGDNGNSYTLIYTSKLFTKHAHSLQFWLMYRWIINIINTYNSTVRVLLLTIGKPTEWLLHRVSRLSEIYPPYYTKQSWERYWKLKMKFHIIFICIQKMHYLFIIDGLWWWNRLNKTFPFQQIRTVTVEAYEFSQRVELTTTDVIVAAHGCYSKHKWDFSWEVILIGLPVGFMSKSSYSKLSSFLQNFNTYYLI